MSRQQVTRLVPVEVYECDSPACVDTCDKVYSSPQCNWVRFDDWTKLVNPYKGNESPTWLWFCSYRCLSAWALAKAAEVGEQIG